MRTILNMGVIGVAAFFIFATAAFAQERPADIRLNVGGSGRNPGGIYRPIASTTASTTNVKIGKTVLERAQAAREEAQSRITAQREKAKERLSDIRDKEKQQKAERIIEQLDKLNQKWTDHFMQLLDRHVAVLQKIQDRADIVSGNGKDITAVTSAIKSAQTAIESARMAVITQASRTYELDASSITSAVATTTSNGQSELVKKLRTSFQNLHKVLFKDLFALRDGSMTDVRKAMQNALQALKGISGTDDKSATSTSSE